MQKKFGEYLIQREVIDATTLVEALHMQGKRNIMQLGETAIENRVLTPEQLLDILSVQDTLDERFEDIALHLDYLTQDQIDDLRTKQVKEQQYIGEILVALHKITPAKMKMLLRDFNAQLVH